jgi:hypothetical protein
MMIPLSKVTKDQIGYDVPMSTLRRWVALGIFPGVKMGGRWFVEINGAVPTNWEAVKRRAKNPRQIELPLDEVPAIEAGRLGIREEPLVLRDPFDPGAPGWVQAAADMAESGERVRPELARNLRAWMEGVDLPADEPQEDPALYRMRAPTPERVYVRSWSEPSAPDWVKELGEVVHAGEEVDPGELERLQNWMRGIDQT